jgi:Glucosamine 6-phosphate synthetase, contains amidotransferase and phosphosugar isomerase domains
MNVLHKYDPKGMLGIIADEYLQTQLGVEVLSPEHDAREIKNIVISGMGNSGISAAIVKSWLSDALNLPLDIIQDHRIPASVGYNTLFIALSFSGETSEVLSCFEQAREVDAQIAVITSGGQLLRSSANSDIAHVQLSKKPHPHFSTILEVKALAKILSTFSIISDDFVEQVQRLGSWLKSESVLWTNISDMGDNYAKQLAIEAHSKMDMIYSCATFTPIAHRWAINWNISGQRTFFERLPSDPQYEILEGDAFSVFNIRSQIDHSCTHDNFESKKIAFKKINIPTIDIFLKGDTLLAQLLWGSVLGDFVGAYISIINKQKIRS